MTPATRRIRAVAARVFSAATMERLVDPILCDIELEHRAHLEAGNQWRARAALFSGFAGLCRAVLLHMLQVCAGALVFDDAAQRMMWVSVISFTTVTVALMLPPLLSGGLFTRHPGLAVYLVPQAIPFSIPIALSFGIVWGWSKPSAGRVMLRRVVVVGLTGVVISLATMEWFVPAGNQGFRVAVTRLLAPAGIKPTVPRGIGERSISELAALIRLTSETRPFSVSEYERISKDLQGLSGAARRGRPLTLEGLQLQLHVRVALGFATLALAILAVATAATLHRRNLARTTFCILVLLYVSSWFGVEAMAPAVAPPVAAWLPNAGAVTISLVLLAVSFLRRDHLAPTDA